MNSSKPYKGRIVAVLGLGRSGRAAIRLLKSLGAEVAGIDSGSSRALDLVAAELSAEGIPCLIGPAASEHPGKFDFAILSPGIDPKSALIQNWPETGGPFISEIELAWRHCPAQVVAVTGTNGKTTTTGLIAHLLNQIGKKAVACGNIGTPFSAALLEHRKTDIFVVEVSSFQLESCDTFCPKVAVWTNFSANHLDRYPSIDEYFLAKARVFQSQTREDFAVVQLDSRLPAVSSRKISFSATQEGGDFILKDGWIEFHGRPVLEQSKTSLPGLHNAENLMAALGVIHALGFEMESAVRGVSKYEPPEHRCEPVAEIEGILFLNDSKSTNLDALGKAILSQTRPVILIAGGKDKGFGYGELADLAREKVSHAILIGEMKERIAKDWSGVPCTLAGDLTHAVGLAVACAPPGAVVLFSPGTSSFDMFSDYEERGRAFKEAVFHNSLPITTNQKSKP